MEDFLQFVGFITCCGAAATGLAAAIYFIVEVFDMCREIVDLKERVSKNYEIVESVACRVDALEEANGKKA